MTLKPHERRQNQAGPLRKKKPGRVPNGLSLDLHKDRLNHNNHQHHHSDQENNPRLAHTHSKKKKYLQKKPRPVSPTSSFQTALGRFVSWSFSTILCLSFSTWLSKTVQRQLVLLVLKQSSYVFHLHLITINFIETLLCLCFYEFLYKIKSWLDCVLRWCKSTVMLISQSRV